MKNRIMRGLICIWAIMVTFCLMAGTVSASTNGHTQEEAVAWINDMVGTAIDADGAAGVQCVDLIKMYYAYLGQNLGSIGYAYNMKSAGLPSGWNRYYNDPKPGDIFVWDANSYGASWTGHVGLIIDVSDSDYTYVDYNGGNHHDKGTVRTKNGKNSFTCVIRPDFAPSIIYGSEMPIGYDRTIPDGDYQIVMTFPPPTAPMFRFGKSAMLFGHKMFLP